MATELYVTLIADSKLTGSGLTTKIMAEKDENYKECIDSSSPDPAVTFYPGTNAEATCVPLSSGMCASEDTKYGVYLYINDDYSGTNEVGGCHFYKSVDEDWKSGEVWSSNFYNVAVKSNDASDDNKYTCTVSPLPPSICVSLKSDSTLNSKGLNSAITAVFDTETSSNISKVFIDSPFGPDTSAATATCYLTSNTVDAKFEILFSAVDPTTGVSTSVGSVLFEWETSTSQWAVSSISKPENGYQVYAPPATSTGNFTVTIEPS